MSISAVGAAQPSAPQRAGQQPEPTEELTTVTTHCNKKHLHDPSCPHTVTTRPAPKAGEPGRLLDQRA